MAHRYVVLGAGRQGTAAAYDLALHGDADRVVLGDLDLSLARSSAKRVDDVAGTKVATAAKVDVTKTDSVRRALKGADVVVSAVPYRFNLALAKWAVKAKASFVDLGGNTDLVRRELALDPAAKRAGVAIVPDCGMGPGANVTLAVHAIALLDRADAVHVYDGGLPQDPSPPWNFALTFHVAGLTNEYTGRAAFLRDGKVVDVPALTEPEDLVVPPLGRLEALVTSGGLSTMPWTYEGRLRVLENKTLRYPGHWAQIRTFADLGLLSEEPIRVRGKAVVPREVFHALFEPRVTPEEIRDVAVIRAVARGERGGRRAVAVVDLFDWYDPETGFRAMERVTGFHASIVAAIAGRGALAPGAHAVESVPPGPVVEEAKRRGLSITARVE